MYRYSKFADTIFVTYTLYLFVLYIFVNFGGSGSDPYAGQGYRWYLNIIPLLLTIFAFIFVLIAQGKLVVSDVVLWLLIYTCGVFLVAILNQDIKHISEILRWSLPFIAINQFRLFLPHQILNALFIFALLSLIVIYNPMESNFGYLPGQTSVNLHQGLWWRISIWQYWTPPFSAAFALLVIILNHFFNKSKSRYLLFAIAIYFLLLSGSRTSYYAFLSFLFIIFLFKKVPFRDCRFYRFIPIFFALMMFVLQLAPEFIYLIKFDNELISSAIFRNEAEGEEETISSRLVIIAEHFRLIAEKGAFGLLGIGSAVDLSPGWTSNGGIIGSTGDSLLTHFAARDGIWSLFLLLAFRAFLKESLLDGDKLAFITLTMLAIYCVGYGGWLHFSNPLFLGYMGSLYMSRRSPYSTSGV